MLKKILMLLAGSLFCILFSCQEEAVYSVKVRLDNLEGKEVYAVFEADDMKRIDTLSSPGGNEFILMEMEETFHSLTLYFENPAQWITVYLEPHRRITVTGDILYPRLAKVKGGRINDRLTEFREKASALLKEQTDLTHLMDAPQEGQNAGKYVSRLTNIHHELSLLADAFIRKHPDDGASAVLIGEYFSDPETPLLTEEYLNLLNPALDGFYVVRGLRETVEKAKRTVAGAKAPEFAVTNLNGVSFRPDSFAGRYFILAFVSSWSDNCQTDELLLDEIQSAYPPEKVEVMTVSLDEDPRPVRELIRRDSVAWNVVTDSAGQAIGLMDLYNVNIIPRCYLVDGEGTILLKTENGIELRRVLEELVNKD
ncbi:MAG: TlpA family protein disulfide reductase [Tannerella sp.]|jgi:peroxiredoxin|nr:TlpA family protein disulfide reductase [Tannerella sp.]